MFLMFCLRNFYAYFGSLKMIFKCTTIFLNTLLTFEDKARNCVSSVGLITNEENLFCLRIFGGLTCLSHFGNNKSGLTTLKLIGSLDKPIFLFLFTPDSNLTKPIFDCFRSFISRCKDDNSSLMGCYSVLTAAAVNNITQ